MRVTILAAAMCALAAEAVQPSTVNLELERIDGRVIRVATEEFVVPHPFVPTADTTVRITLKTDRTCDGVFYWQSESMKTFSYSFGERFSIVGDGRFRTYELRPDWQMTNRLVKIHLDFPIKRVIPDICVAYDLDSVIFARRGAAPFEAKEADGVVFRMKSSEFEFLSLNWRAVGKRGDTAPFRLGFTSIPDGREHLYWFDLKNTRTGITVGSPHWYGKIEGFCLRANLRHEERTMDGLSFVSGTPDLPADPVVRQVFAEDALPRAGRPLPLEIVVRNYGTRPADGIRFSLSGLPEGVRVLNPRDLAPGGAIAPSAGYDYIGGSYLTNGLPNERRFRITLSDPGRPVEFVAKLTLAAANGATSAKDFRVKVLPSLNLTPVTYPPEPKPIDTGDIEVGAILFPGWVRHQWHPVWDSMPWRKPMLGWYDDTLPEVRDWQIKWLVENGISYVFVDWYWVPEKGPRDWNCWLETIGKARYRKYLKYAALWCNEGSYRHSVKDQEMVTKHWIDHFFADPQYMKIDGKPVVGMWAFNMDRNFAAGGAKALIAVSQRIAQEAGYPGIHFVSMMGAEANRRPHLKDVGVSSIFEYFYSTRWTRHWPGLVNGLMDYSAVADSSYAHWQEVRESCDLPFFPSISTGTDCRPWTGDRGWGISGKTPAKFAQICRDAKRFSEETGIKRLLVGPLDEWCEGEIAYPNAEHGFGMFEAVRETFGRKPPEGFPLNYAPQDVGLGPYTKPNSVMRDGE